MKINIKFKLGDFVETYEKKDFYLKSISVRTICDRSIHFVLTDKSGKNRQYEILTDVVKGDIEFNSQFCLGEVTNKGVIRAIFFTESGNLYLTNDYTHKFKENEIQAI